MESNHYTYILVAKKANYEQGILNIPTRYGEYFGDYNSLMVLQIENRPPIARNIDRNNVKNRSPRISSNILKEYFQGKDAMGSNYEVSITKNHIKIKLRDGIFVHSL